tara:strand:+ start:3088 stop:4968 length:1881 start_codon:yes stop_codon:yes gene_type:complete
MAENIVRPKTPDGGGSQKGVFTDIKKALIEANGHQAETKAAVMGLQSHFEKMMDMQNAAKMDNLESDRESAQKVAAGTASLASTAGPTAPKEKSKGGVSGLLGKLLGGGAALAIGGALGMAAAAIVAILNIDTKAIKSSVKDLLSISDEVGGVGDMFMKGGVFLLTMTGIGLGLAVFGVGSAIVGLSGALTSFLNPNWAQGILDNVVILLGLKDKLGGNIAEILGSTGVFLAVMTGVGMGLAVFGIGSAVAGLAGALTSFLNPNWASGIVNNVVTLLGLQDKLGGGILKTLGKAGVFLIVMTGVAAGLAVFGAGSALAGALTYFQDPAFSQGIVDSVVTLMKIVPALGGTEAALGKGGTFFLVMTGIGAGLAVFGVGTAIAGVAQKFSGTDFAQKTVDSVVTLLSITDKLGKDPLAKAALFSGAMGSIGAGLLKFAGGSLVGTLASAGEALLGFFGVKSPFEKIMDIVDQREGLEQGAIAMNSLTASISKLGSLTFDGSKLKLKDFADDLKDAVPVIEAAIMGEKGGMFFGTDIKGLASPDVKYDEAISNLKKIISVMPGSGPKLAAETGPDGNPAGGGTTVAPTTVINNYYNTSNTSNNVASSQAKAGHDPLAAARSRYRRQIEK